MSTKRLEHLKEGDKIYLEVTRRRDICDDEMSLLFKTINNQEIAVDDDDTFYALADLKQLANDGMPKQVRKQR